MILASYRIRPKAGDWVARFGADPGESNGEALRHWVARELEGWERELGVLLLHRLMARLDRVLAEEDAA